MKVISTVIFLFGLGFPNQAFPDVALPPGYYTIGKTTLELRVLPSDRDSQKPPIGDLETLSDVHGTTTPVGTESLFSSADIDRVLVKANNDEGQGFLVLFAESSWDRVNAATLKHVGDRTVLVCNGKIVSAPTIVREAIREAVQFSLHDQEAVAFLIRDFTSAPPPSDDREAHITQRKFDEASASEDPNNKMMAAFEFNAAKDYAKTIALLEPISEKAGTKIDPNVAIMLSQAYAGNDQLPKAVQLLSNCLAADRRNWIAREAFAEMKAKQGDYKTAYEELRRFESDLSLTYANMVFQMRLKENSKIAGSEKVVADLKASIEGNESLQGLPHPEK